ncbi:MAG: ABC transporter permease [Gammaproteobacteria bacterium]|nr:ABC transporter permease [Gammaproteobacteria bacterium]
MPTARSGRTSRRGTRPVWRLVGGRILAALGVLFGVSLLAFVVLDLLPGSAAQQLAGADATAEQVARLTQALRLERPAHERYIEWFVGVLRGDLGVSLASGQSVRVILAERLPVTIELVALSFALALGTAVPVALLAARESGGLFDRLSAVICLAGLATARYVLAILLVLLFAVELRLLPAIGYIPLGTGIAGNLRTLALPVATLALPLFALYARFLRADLLEQLRGEEYIVTAIAKGLGPWRVLLRHALPNSLLGLSTLVGLHVGTLFGGTLVVERIFALPGLGQLLLQAVTLRDTVVVQASVLVLAAATVLGNLAVDLLYTLLDPRLRHD